MEKLLTTSKHTGKQEQVGQGTSKDQVSARPTIQRNLCDIPHGVLHSPNDAVGEQLELGRWKGQECCSGLANVKQ